MCGDCSQEEPDNLVLTQYEQEALLTEYQEMREEVRTNITILHQRLSRGIAAIGFVVGYALLAPGGSVFISIVPVLIAVLFFLTIQSIQDVLVIGRHIYDIEELVPVDEFGWEHRYGGFLKKNMRSTQWSRWERIDFMHLPGEVVIGLGILIYAAFLYLGYIAVDQRPDIAGLDPALLILGFYTILTILIGVVTRSYIIMMDSLQPGDNS